MIPVTNGRGKESQYQAGLQIGQKMEINAISLEINAIFWKCQQPYTV